MMWDYGGHMGWMGLWWIVGLGLLIVFLWLVVRAATPPSTGEGQSPETILKSRYARGELDRDEYERRLADLRK